MLLIWLEDCSYVITIISSFLELDSDVAENYQGGGLLRKWMYFNNNNAFFFKLGWVYTKVIEVHVCIPAVFAITKECKVLSAGH